MIAQLDGWELGCDNVSQWRPAYTKAYRHHSKHGYDADLEWVGNRAWGAECAHSEQGTGLYRCSGQK